MERRAAQVVVAPVDETDAYAAAPLVAEGIGGLILLGESAPSELPAQLADLREQSLDSVAPLVMTDEEGGEIQRMANLVGDLPWPRTMAATMSPPAVRSLATRVGQAMFADGVDMDLAPVLDLSDSPGPDAQYPDGPRSFSLYPSIAARYGLAFAHGLLAGGVIPVVKHFPGLGEATGNTDDGPATVPSVATLERGALIPFRSAINAGLPAVMIANAMVAGLTGNTPAALSRVVVTGLLRGQLGFKGLILTDSLSADAIVDAGYDLASAAWHALRAGDDLLLYTASDPIAAAQEIIEGISGAVASGLLSPLELDDAVVHVLTAKGINPCN